ncbi:MAG: hypothetical protein V1927_02125 [Candidatus Omnitrophota bacterium]
MKKNDKAQKSKEFDLERETRALLENMHSDIKKIAEAQSSHGNRLDKIETAVKEIPTIRSEIKIISMAVEANSKDLKDIKSELHSMNMALMDISHVTENHEKRIKKVEEKVFV